MLLKRLTFLLSGCIMMLFSANSCNDNSPGEEDQGNNSYPPGTFGYDVDFLKTYDPGLLILGDSLSGGQIIVSPRYQGKVFTSTIGKADDPSLGWINYKEIAADSIRPHMNAYGGENRMWLGPEGGQYSIFFEKGTDFTFENWQTPSATDSEPWAVTTRDERSVQLEKSAALSNYSGRRFDLRMERTVTLLDSVATAALLPPSARALPAVAYRTVNTVINTGDNSWTPEGGSISIWMLDMFPPGEQTAVIIPYLTASEEPEIVRSDYFGTVPPQRLEVTDSVVLFRADGKQRGKIGVPPRRATPVAGSVDLTNQLVTLVQFDLEPSSQYPRQEWKLHDQPYTGDAINAYNDGPLEDGTQMGPFFEIESVSPAAFLAPGERATHHHTVLHLRATEADMERILPQLLKTDLQTIKKFLAL